VLLRVKEIIWGPATISLLLLFGIYFTLKTKFYRPKAILKTIRDTLGSLKKQDGNGISPFASVATALGGTVGVGSIIGVGYGIAVGGAGSIFWMWVCSFFGMGLKYAEVKIALLDRKSNGGAPFRLRELGYRKTAALFAVFCIIAAFGTGNLTQTGVIGDFTGSLGLSPFLSALIIVLLVSFAVFGGRKRISDINKFLVPAASAFYLVVCIAILIINRRGIPLAVSRIVGNAFGISALTGGFSGALISQGLREGFARSIFSNEAGMGSSPLAHGTSREQDPSVQAEWGIFEIFFDTFAVSTLTALCILSSDSQSAESIFSICFGSFGRDIFLLLIGILAFASVISWYYYAECCLEFLFPGNKSLFKIYGLLFSLAAAGGVFINSQTLWVMSDILNALMMFPNLFLLYKCRKEIERIK